MKPTFHRRVGWTGFTLVEMLVVIGLIVLLVGGGGAVLQRPADVALRAAQLEIASLVARTRAVALNRQCVARLVVDADAAGDHPRGGFMRRLQILEENPATSAWSASGPGVSLPGGAKIAPPAGIGTGQAGAVHSNLQSDMVAGLDPDDPERITQVAYLAFGPNGSLISAADVTIVLVNGPEPGGVNSTHRALKVSAQGTVTLEASRRTQ